MLRKRILSKMLAFALSVSLAVPAFYGMSVYDISAQTMNDANEFTVTFEEEYPKVGQELRVNITGLNANESCDYTWKVDNTTVSYDEVYTPGENDLEKFITVVVNTSEGRSVEHSVYFSKLPVVYIDTNDVPVLDKENYVNGTMKIQGNERYNLSNSTLYDGALEIRGRGNSSWEAPKKPYRIKLDEKADLMGMGANKHWTLLANYYDPSLSRNKLSFDFSGELGLAYMESENVILIMNDTYQGVYQLCEHIRIDKTRINITDWESIAEDTADAIAEAVSDVDAGDLEDYLVENMDWITNEEIVFDGNTYNLDDYSIELPDIDGGYLLELDKNLDEVSSFYSNNNQPLMFKSPEYVKTNDDMMDYVKNYVNTFEEAIAAPDGYTTYHGEEVHYSELYDIDAFAQYFLVTELFFNVDGMKKSTYMYKDNDELMKMGPIWDMDWSAGGPVAEATPVDRWQTLYYDDEIAEKQWYRFVTKDPYFAFKVKSLYDTYRNLIDSLVTEGGLIDQNVDYLLEAGRKNDTRWQQGNGFERDIENLKDWLKERIAWLDAQMESVDSLLESWGKYNSNQESSPVVSINHISSEENGISVNIHTESSEVVGVYVNGIKYTEEAPIDNMVELVIPFENMEGLGQQDKALVVVRTMYNGQICTAYQEVDVNTPDIPEPTPTPEVTPTLTPGVLPTPTPEVTPIPQPSPGPMQKNPFTDIKEVDYYYDSVLWAVREKITFGWTETLFVPAMHCTRGQMVTFLWRAAGCPEVDTSKNTFKDVPEDSYYYKAICWAVENNITYGYTTETFAPDDGCTRAQIVTFLWRANDEEVPKTESNPFDDVQTAEYYYKAVLWAVENNITKGITENTFAPYADCSRAEAVTFLYRASLK